MASSDSALKALFDNPEFLSKFQNLVNEHCTNGAIEHGGTNSKNNKRQSVGNRAKRIYKRRKVANQSPQNQNDSITDVKSLLQDEDVKKKIAPYISECIQLTANSDNSPDKKLAKIIQKNVITIDTSEEIVRKVGVEEIIFPDHSAAVMKLPGEPLVNIKTKRKSFKQNGSGLYFAGTKHTENVLLNKETTFHVKDEIKVVNTIENHFKTQSAGIVVNKETINDSLKKNNIIRLVPIQIIKNRHISPDKTNTTDKSISLEQSTDYLNTQKNEENCEMSQSDDIYYLSMINGLHTSALDIPEILQEKNPNGNILDNSNINNSTIMIEPNISIPEFNQNALKSVIKSNDYETAKLPNRIVRRITIPNCKIGDQISATNPESVGLVSTQNTSTIIVLTDNGEQSVKIQNAQKKVGPKPVIKSNERVIQGKIILEGKTIRKIGNDINNSVVSDICDNIITNADPTDSFKLPKIESVMSYAESLPRITSVTSCATSVSNIENVVTHTSDSQCTEDISLAERISAIPTISNEKILKITRPATKIKGKKKLQHKAMERAKDINRKFEKSSNSLSTSTTVDTTIEEVIAQGVDEIQGTNSVALDEKKSQNGPNIHINGLSTSSPPRKGLNVLKPVKRIELSNNDIQNKIDNVNFVTEESVDRSGLPSIKNVMSLATNYVLDDCLEKANHNNNNGLYTTNTPEKKIKVLKPVGINDDAFQLSSELFENLHVDLETGNDDFNFAIDSLIEDISREKLDKKSPIKKKAPPPSLRKQFGALNSRNKGFKVLKPAIRRKKRGKRKAMFTRRKIRIVDNSIQNVIENVENSIQSGIDNVKSSIQNGTVNVDFMGMNFADVNLIDTQSTFVDSEYNDAPFNKSTTIKMDILRSKLSPTKSLEKHKSDTSCIAKEQTESANSYIAEPPPDNSKTAIEEPLDDSIRAVEESEELLEEVPLHQRRCNNFYVKVPTGEELGSNIDLAEYEKFFSIQDENHPTKKIQEVEIESLDNDEDLPGTPGKRRTKCSKCDRTFVNSTNRKIHEATCEVTDPQSSECSKCGRWFARIAYRKIHEKKCQKVYGTIEVPVTPLNDILRCAMCPFNTGHKTAYINHLKSHMYSHNKTTTLSSRTVALRRKFGYRRKKRKLRFGALKNRCEICSDDAAGVEHMVSRCRRCGAFNLQWCDVCHEGGYSTACRLKHHEAKCTATPHTRCNDVPRVHVEKIGPPLPLHCVSCDVTRTLYVREKRCRQCSSQLVFKCEMCAELRDTFAELVGHVARAHIYGFLVQCNDCGKNYEDITLHRRVCESERKKNDSPANTEINHVSEDGDSNEETPRFMDSLILELEEESDEGQNLRIEEV